MFGFIFYLGFLFGLISAYTLFCLFFFHADAVYFTLVSCWDIVFSFVVVFNTVAHSYIVPLILAVLPQSGGFIGECVVFNIRFSFSWK